MIYLVCSRLTTTLGGPVNVFVYEYDCSLLFADVA